MKLKNKFWAWLILLIIAATAFAFAAVPVWLIMPFKAQTATGLSVSLWLKSWSPIVTVILTVLAFVVAARLWIGSQWLVTKAVLIMPLALLLILTWFARQNHFEWMFNPLGESQFVKASDVDFVQDTDVVLAVNLNGEAAAYPVRQMAYHHIASDVVGGTPITATY